MSLLQLRRPTVAAAGSDRITQGVVLHKKPRTHRDRRSAQNRSPIAAGDALELEGRGHRRTRYARCRWAGSCSVTRFRRVRGAQRGLASPLGPRRRSCASSAPLGTALPCSWSLARGRSCGSASSRGTPWTTWRRTTPPGPAGSTTRWFRPCLTGTLPARNDSDSRSGSSTSLRPPRQRANGGTWRGRTSRPTRPAGVRRGRV